MVFEALFEDFYSSKFRSKTKILKAVERNGLLDTQQSVSFVSSSTNCLPALFDGRLKRFISRKPYACIPHL